MSSTANFIVYHEHDDKEITRKVRDVSNIRFNEEVVELYREGETLPELIVPFIDLISIKRFRE